MTDQEGSPEAFRDLFFQYYSSFFSFALSLVQDKASAMNLTMEALYIFWLKRTYVTGEVNSRAFYIILFAAMRWLI